MPSGFVITRHMSSFCLFQSLNCGRDEKGKGKLYLSNSGELPAGSKVFLSDFSASTQRL